MIYTRFSYLGGGAHNQGTELEGSAATASHYAVISSSAFPALFSSEVTRKKTGVILRASNAEIDRIDLLLPCTYPYAREVGMICRKFQ